MREIKFRALDLNGEEWHIGLPSYDADGDYVFTNDGGWDCQVDFETVTEYTGFKDDDGNECFEGDIVRAGFGIPTTLVIAEVYKEKGCMMIRLLIKNKQIKPQICPMFEFVENLGQFWIDGNIYQNPELLDA